MTVPVTALYYQFLVPADSIPEAESPAIPLDPFNEFQSMTMSLNSIQSSVSFVTVSPTSPMVKQHVDWVGLQNGYHRVVVVLVPMEE